MQSQRSTPHLLMRGLGVEGHKIWGEDLGALCCDSAHSGQLALGGEALDLKRLCHICCSPLDLGQSIEHTKAKSETEKWDSLRDFEEREGGSTDNRDGLWAPPIGSAGT